MVKGTSRQVIVVRSPDPKLFEQAIFILKEGAVGQGVTDEMLLKEARQAARSNERNGAIPLWGPLWAFGGAMVTGLVWFMTWLL